MKKSLINEIRGDFLVVEYLDDKKYRCQCTKCGHVIESFSANINERLRCQQCKPGYTKNLIGQEFGLLVVTGYNKETKKWKCRCVCGETTEVKSNNLKNGNTASCGKCNYIKHAGSDVAGGTRLSQINRKISKNNTSGIPGVSWNIRKEKWQASIRFGGKNYFLGYHDNKEFAGELVEEAKLRLTSNFLDWYEEFKKKSTQCKVCGKLFISKNGLGLHCSDECRHKSLNQLKVKHDKLHYETPLPEEKSCIICVEKFFQKHRNETMCSWICKEERKAEHARQASIEKSKRKGKELQKKCVICGELFHPHGKQKPVLTNVEKNYTGKARQGGKRHGKKEQKKTKKRITRNCRPSCRLFLMQ